MANQRTAPEVDRLFTALAAMAQRAENGTDRSDVLFTMSTVNRALDSLPPECRAAAARYMLRLLRGR